MSLQVTQNKLVSASEDHTLCVWYYKMWKASKEVRGGICAADSLKAIVMTLFLQYEEVLMEESDPTFPDIPIRVVTD